MLYKKNYFFPALLFIVLVVVIAINFLYLSPKISSDKKTVFSLGVPGMTERGLIPMSNWEWLGAISANTRGFLDKFIATSTFSGKVVEVSENPGKEKLKASYYYVGERGYYAYNGKISLESENGKVQPFLFSPRRIKDAKVVEVTESGELPREFKDIKVGQSIEIEEAVDLALPNVNDENLVSLTIRILR